MSKRHTNVRRFGRVTVSSHVAKVFAQHREALGMSLRDVSAKADVALGTVQSSEKGDVTIRLDTFLKVLAAVDLLPRCVLQMDGENASPEPLTLD
jgi:hypothetical protein